MSRNIFCLLLCYIIIIGNIEARNPNISVARLHGRFVYKEANVADMIIPKTVVLTEDLFCDTLMADVNNEGKFSFIMPLVRPMLCKLYLNGKIEYIYMEPETDTKIEIPIVSGGNFDYSDIRQTGSYADLVKVWNKRSSTPSEYELVNKQIEEILLHQNCKGLSYLDSLSLLLQDTRIQMCPAYHLLCQKLMDIHYIPPKYIADELKVRWLKKQMWDRYQYLDEQQQYSAQSLSEGYQQYLAVHSLHIPSRLRITKSDTTIVPYTDRVLPENIISGQLKSRKKKVLIDNRDITVILNNTNSNYSKRSVMTDSTGRFSINIGDYCYEDNVSVLFMLKGEDAKYCYLTIEPYRYQDDRIGLEAALKSEDWVHYSVDAIVDSLENIGGKVPLLLDWLFKKDRKFQGTYGLLEPHSYAYDESDKLFDYEGPTYKSRPIIWILNDKFIALTGKHSHAIQFCASRWTDEKLTHALKDARDVYISLKDKVWRPWFVEDNLSLATPATVLIYTHPKSVDSPNIIRKIHIKNI